MSPRDLELGCECGRVRGRVLGASPARGTRLVCYCADCRAFAHHIGASGMLDAHGGTEIYQTLPGRVRIDAGLSRLRSLLMAEGGLLRFHAGCCGTPFGNMLATHKIRFVGLPLAAFSDAQAASAMGPVLAWVNTGGARPREGAPAETGRKLAYRRGVIRHLLSGAGLAPRGSPYFDDQGNPVVVPHVLSEAEREAAYRAAG